MSSASAGLVLQQQDSICAYTISGQYGFLVRLLFIILLVLAIVFHTHPWIFNGAVAATMLYSSIAAIHTLLLISDFAITNAQLDLDIFPAYCITCIAGTTPIHLRLFNKSVEVPPRGWLVIKLWDNLLWISSTVTWITFLAVQAPASPPRGICSARAGFLREGQTMIEIENSFQYYLTEFDVIIMGPWIWGMLCWTIYYIYDMMKSHHVRFTCFNWAGMFLLLLEFALPSASNRLIAVWQYVMHFLSWCALIIYIIAMELVLYQSRMPVGETAVAVGQWAPVVSSFLVVVGAGLIAGVPDFDFEVKWLNNFGISAKEGDISWRFRPRGAVGDGTTRGGPILGV